MSKSVLIVDDHEMLCSAFASQIMLRSDEFSNEPIVATPVYTMDAALERITVETGRPDVVLLDLNMGPDLKGAETLRMFQKENIYKIPVAILTATDAQDQHGVQTLRECLNLGAHGILLKSASVESMSQGLRRIIALQGWMPPDVLMAMARAKPEPAPDENAVGHANLTNREWDVARCLTEGLTDKEIARELELQPTYIRQVTSAIYQKLGVSNRVKAALLLSNFKPGDGND